MNETSIIQAAVQTGVAGLVMWLVAKPLIAGLIRRAEGDAKTVASALGEIGKAREERETLCTSHQAFHEKTNTVLTGLMQSVSALVVRANGGK